MLKLSEEVRKILLVQSFFRAGIVYRLLNLKQVAIFLLPHLEARLKKSLTVGAVHVALTRVVKEHFPRGAGAEAPSLAVLPKKPLAPDQILPNLFWVRYKKTKASLSYFQKLLQFLNTEQAWVYKVESGQSLELIVSQRYLEEFSYKIPMKATHIASNFVLLQYKGSMKERVQMLQEVMVWMELEQLPIIFLQNNAKELLLGVKKEHLHYFC